MGDLLSDISMKQLAQLAGLDVSTVSRALRGDTKRVAAATIERVQKLADETGFVVDPAAASLRSGRSRLIGVVVQSLTDIVMGILVTAIEDAAHRADYLALVVATHEDKQARATAVRRLLGRRVDGLILCDALVGDEVPDQVHGSGVPFMFAMRGCDTEVSVVANDRLGGILVAEHFIGSGHTVVAAIAGPERARTAVDRLAGFEQAIASTAGVECRPPRTSGGFSVEDGYRATRSLLEMPGPRPTAVFCVNDHTAIGAARAICDRGLRVGVDIALVGYNDIPQAAYLETPLSSVRTDVAAMGRAAGDQLLNMIEGRPTASVKLEPTLVIRESSDSMRFRSLNT
jgi:LacI family transcriptional regulator